MNRAHTSPSKRLVLAVAFGLACVFGVGWLLASKSPIDARATSLSTMHPPHVGPVDPSVPVYGPDGEYLGSREPAASRPQRARNLVVIAIGALRADALAIESAPIDPLTELAALAAGATALTEVTAPAPSTLASLTSLLTGYAPDLHGVDDAPQPPILSPGITSYAEALGRGHGYETCAVTEHVFPRGPESVLQGFENVRTGVELAAVPARIAAWERQRAVDAPFFMLVQAEGGAAPYAPRTHARARHAERPSERRSFPHELLTNARFVEDYLFDADLRAAWLGVSPHLTRRRAARFLTRGFAAEPDDVLRWRLEDGYRAKMADVDVDVARIVDSLQDSGLLANTLLVVTGLHGVAFGEHGVLGSGATLHQEHVHVPCVMRGPAPFLPNQRLGTSIGLVDLIPTFMELAELPALGNRAGRSMLRELEQRAPGRAVTSVERLSTYKMGRISDAFIVGARTATETYHITYDMRAGTVVEALFNRAADPLETRDLALAGRVGTNRVSETLGLAIEGARDRIWHQVASSRDHVQMGYGAGVGTVTSDRPPPVRVSRP